MKDIKRIQKLVPKGEKLIERYAKGEGEETGWFVARKTDGVYLMYHIENGKAVKLGKASNPVELDKYVTWCNA